MNDIVDVPRSVKPQIAAPLLVGGTVAGRLVFSAVGAERARSDELIQQFHLLGEAFARRHKPKVQ